MNDDPRVQKLIDCLLSGESTPEEVCASCPELLPEVKALWRRICHVQAEVDACFPAPNAPAAHLSALPLESNALPQIPGYETEALISRGGMGIVFRARQLRLNRVVALKMLLAGAYAGPHERERFQREAEAVAALRHPNVVQIYDIGESDGRPYFTMELVEGGNLSAKLADTPQPSRDAAALLATLARAVQAAHGAGIVHRDLKPANVLLSEDGIPKISDFGLARRLNDGTGLTRTGTAVGTPNYMAPEQAAGQAAAIGPAVDIYALGAILYQMLTGRPPFLAETAAATIQQVISQEPVPPSRLNAKVPRDLETICMKCLHKEPPFRYAAADALADDLDCFLRGETISARPEGRLGRLLRRVRRRPVRSAAVAVAILLTFFPLGAGAWLISERAADKWRMEANEAAIEREVKDHLRDMVRGLNNSSWREARAAQERARVRLGHHESVELRRLLEQGESDVAFAARLDNIRINNRATDPVNVFTEYEKAFQDAELFKIGDDSEVAAMRIKESNIRQALVATIDYWALSATYSKDAKYEAWLLDVAKKADPDLGGWRERLRDPQVRRNKTELFALANSAKLDTVPVNLLVQLGELIYRRGGDAIPFMVKVQRQYPNDLWANFVLGGLADNPTDAIRYYQTALAIRPETPFLYYDLGYALRWGGRLDDSIYYCARAVQQEPESARFCAGLASVLVAAGRDREANAQIQRGLGLPIESAESTMSLQHSLSCVLLREGRLEEARLAWRAAVETNMPRHDVWYGYAEFCLFLGHENEYRRNRRALLAKFGDSTDPYTAERTSRACLLLPATGDELRQAAALAERAASADRSKYAGAYRHFQFVKGLAQFRQGQFDQAISTMKGDAARVLGPAPRLVLAMALHRAGQETEARDTLAAALLAHDWIAKKGVDQDGWICHVLRHEAEALIMQKLPAVLNKPDKPRTVDK